MKRHTIILLALLCVAALTRANVVTGVAAVPDNYYSAVDNKGSAESILNSLNSIIDDHTVISYSGLEPYYEQTDFYADTLWDMYSTCRFTMAHANISQKAVCDGWNKEHVCCQSWLGSGPMVSDLFNVYPTDARINNLRSNYPYGVVGGTFNGFSKDPDHHGLGKLGTSTTSGVGTVYEPDDQYKGDFARTFFYMVARYRSNVLNSGNGSTMFTANPTNLTSYSLSFLLEWHRQDPVSQKEIDRNQAVYGIQHNRNPFIDFPYLVEYIWGVHAGETLDMSLLLASCDPAFVPGQSDGQRGNIPVIQTVKYGVSWSVNGDVILTDSIAENGKITALPATPESCSSESETFVGWSDAPINGILNDAPDVLYNKPADFPAVTADVTYYAVFAQAAEMEPVQAPVYDTIVFAENYTDKQEMGVVNHGAVTVTFAQAGSANAPKYYSNGSAVRCYGGNTITVAATNITGIDFTFGSNDGSNGITANTGTFVSPSWTGLADQVIFTIDGSSGNRRISAMTVTMNGSIMEEVYSRYITTCQGTTELIITPANEQQQTAARKLIIGGRIYILIGDQLYNIQGQRIK